MTNPTALVQKPWNYCNILRDDGLSYSDCAEQLTFLLFLKMADEQARPPFNKLLLIFQGKGLARFAGSIRKNEGRPVFVLPANLGSVPMDDET